MITLLLLVVLTFPVIAEEFKSEAEELKYEIEPRAIDCPNCYGYIITERSPREYSEKRGANCRDCSRNFDHTRIEEYIDIVVRCTGSCGYRQTDIKFIRDYCTN